MVERLFLAVPWGCLPFVIGVFPDHTHLLFLVFELAQLTCQIRFDCKHLILRSSATLLDILYSQIAVANVLWDAIFICTLCRIMVIR